MTGPSLSQLLAAIERDGRLPAAFTEERLREAWDGCQNVVCLARVAARAGEPAACAAAQAAVVAWARGLVPAEPRRRSLDWATREALDALDDAFASVTDCEAGHARATDTLADACESVVRAAGLRDWDELLAEAALCEAAPWPDPEYEAMAARREAVEQATSCALAAIVRAHVPCPTLAGLLSEAR